MKAIGIIAEYNPFHNGHKYQIEEAKRLSGADCVIAVVTGYFSMRGDISVLNKYDKAMIAINNGIDVVLELPFTKGCQSADYFSYNAVDILNKAKVSEIWAGSESPNLDTLNKIIELESTDEFNLKIKEYLKEGNSYPKSFKDAINYFGYNLEANDMLNLKYLEAINKINPSIKLNLIQRVGSNYSDKTINDTDYQSASAIRLSDSFEKYVPLDTYNIYKEKGFLNIDNLSEYFKYQLLTNDISDIFQADSEIINIFKKQDGTITEIVENAKSKRYTESKLRRFILYTSFSLKESDITDMDYIRVLGFSEVGKTYLSSIKKETNIITNIRSNMNSNIDFEIKIAKIMSLIYKIDFLKIEQSLPYKK